MNFKTVILGIISVCVLVGCTANSTSFADQGEKVEAKLCNDTSKVCSQSVPSRFSRLKAE